MLFQAYRGIKKIRNKSKKRWIIWIWTPEIKWFIYVNKKKCYSGNILTVFAQNMRSFSNHVDNLVSEYRIIHNNMGFTEKLGNPSDSTCKTSETLNFFTIIFYYYENFLDYMFSLSVQLTKDGNRKA